MNSNSGSITTANSGGTTVPANFTATALASLVISNDGPSTVSIDIDGTWTQSGGLLVLFVLQGGSKVRIVPQTEILSDTSVGTSGIASGASDKFTLGINGAGTLYIMAGAGAWTGSATVILRSSSGGPAPSASSAGDVVAANQGTPNAGAALAWPVIIDPVQLAIPVKTKGYSSTVTETTPTVANNTSVTLVTAGAYSNIVIQNNLPASGGAANNIMVSFANATLTGIVPTSSNIGMVLQPGQIWQEGPNGVTNKAITCYQSSGASTNLIYVRTDV